MDDRPFDRACLERVVRQVGDLGPIGDMGNGLVRSRVTSIVEACRRWALTYQPTWLRKLKG